MYASNGAAAAVVKMYTVTATAFDVNVGVAPKDDIAATSNDNDLATNVGATIAASTAY